MKILVALHQCMDLGGIINHTEQLIGGLQDLGHEVHFRELVWANRASGQNRDGDFIVGPSGIPHHQGKGWNFEAKQRIAYRGNANLQSARQILQRYDMIIWTVPVPSKNKQNLGNSDWPALYDLPKEIKQVAFVHDGNAAKGSAHLIAVQQHLSAIACVHPCALNGAAIFDVPRALVVNPQHQPLRPVNNWETKRPGFVNMQTFKAWKHAHELVEAIAYMPPKKDNELREIAGKGIEYQYMTSEEKCKPQYFHDQNDEWFSSMKFWEAAEQNGMTHHDYWNTGDVDFWLSHARVLVDPSWSKNYSKNGGHFNRVVVDAMIRGCVPVARPLGMGDELFKAGEHYIAIPQDVLVEEYADIVLEAGNMSPVAAQRYRDANRAILPMFDRATVAGRLIGLVNGEIETEATQGTMSKALYEKTDDILFDHFGVFI